MIRADQSLDCRGVFCPMPVSQTNAAIKKLKVGQVLEMITTDPGSKADLNAWTKRTKHELLKQEEMGGLFRFYIRRTR